MRWFFKLAAATVSAVAPLAVSAEPQTSADAPADLRQAIDELDHWLGTDENAGHWRRFLHTSELRAQLARGRAADRGILAKVRDRYNEKAAGLDKHRFARVRQALDAELSTDVPAVDFPALVEAAKGHYNVPTEQDLATAKAKLAGALERLNAYLATGGANGASWRSYLRADDLAAQLNAAAPDVRTLYDIQELFNAQYRGLEMPVFAEVGAAVLQYASLAEAAIPATREEMEKQWTWLNAALPEFAQQPNEETAYEIGSRVGWMARMGQAPSFVKAVRERYGMPNMYVQVSAGLVTAGIGRPIDEITPVTDNILGTSIYGSGHTVGAFRPRLVPNARRAVIENRLEAVSHTKTTGYNGPAIIYASGTTTVDGRVRLVIDDLAVRQEPATACATTKTCITGIDSCKDGIMGNIVVKIASKRAGQQKGQAEQIAARHAEARITRRLDEEVKRELARSQEKMAARNPLLRRRVLPGMFSYATSDEFLHVASLQGDLSQLGAATAPPDVEMAPDLLVQLHETAANNWASAMLSGVTLREEDVQAKVIELRGSLPDQLKSDDERGPWSLTFANARPLSFSFGNGGFKVTIRGKRFTSADRQFRAMNISATYKMNVENGRTRLVRQGELEIFPPGFAEGQTLSTQQITLKTLLQKKFGKLFEPEILTEGLELPGEMKKVGKLSIRNLTAENGWIVLGWMLPSPAADKIADNAR